MTMMPVDIVQRHMVGWTRPAAEFSTAAALREMGFDAFVPAVRLRKPVKCWSRNRGHGKTRDEIVVEPAFPRYVVFSTTAAQMVWQRALKADGMTVVIRKPGNLDQPGTLPSAVVALLRGPLGDGVIDDKSGTVEAIRCFSAGQRITVERAGVPIIGVVVGHEGRDVRVILSLLGGEWEGTVPIEEVVAA